jgi:hypothetical protein
MKTTLKFATLAALSTGALFAEKPAPVDCQKVSVTFTEEVVAHQSLVLQLVDRAVRTNPTCACEIVKAAIKATKADNKLIASIVEVAAVAAPEQLRVVAQCAVAVAPDSLEEVQAVLAKLDPGTGDGVVDSEKGGVDKQPVAVEETPNPLDFPTNGDDAVVFLVPGGGTGGTGGFAGFQPPNVGSNPATKNELNQ